MSDDHGTATGHGTGGREEALSRTIAAAEEQERRVVLAGFDEDTAWQLGTALVAEARRRHLAIALDVRRPGQVLFHAALPGAIPDLDTWIERKSNVVFRFAASSYLVGLRSDAEGTPFAVAHDLPFQRYSAVGGSFPIRVAGAGVVGAVTASGLSPADDHAFVVAGLEALLVP